MSRAASTFLVLVTGLMVMVVVGCNGGTEGSAKASSRPAATLTAEPDGSAPEITLTLTAVGMASRYKAAIVTGDAAILRALTPDQLFTLPMGVTQLFSGEVGNELPRVIEQKGLAMNTTYYYRAVACLIPFLMIGCDLTDVISATTPAGGGNTAVSYCDTHACDPDGWALLTPGADTRVAYVSNAGGSCASYDLSIPGDAAIVGPDPMLPLGEAGDGVMQRACATVLAGRQLVRNGFPDWLLMQRGGTWYPKSGDTYFGAWGGRSLSEMTVIGAYGPLTEPRPHLIYAAGQWEGGVGGHDMEFMAILDLRVENSNPYTMDTGGGIGVNGNDLLVEGNYTFNFKDGCDAIATHNTTIRRNIFDQGHHGCYTAFMMDTVFEENMFYRMGNLEDPPQGTPKAMYISQDANPDKAVIRSNIVAESRRSGFEQREDGVDVVNNLFVRIINAIAVGCGPTWYESPGIKSHVVDNVIIPGDPFGMYGNTTGIQLCHVKDTVVERNIVANAEQKFNGNFGFSFMTWNGYHKSSILRDNIVYETGGAGVRISYDPLLSKPFTNLTLESNDFYSSTELSELITAPKEFLSEIHSAQNRFYSALPENKWFYLDEWGDLAFYKSKVNDTTSTAPGQNNFGYPDPANATIAQYMASLGETPTYDAFIARATQQRKGNWDRKYMAESVNNYIRAAFGR